MNRSKRIQKTIAIAKNRVKFFSSLWGIPWFDGNLLPDLIQGRFRKWNGSCSSNTCKNERYDRAKEKREWRNEQLVDKY